MKITCESCGAKYTIADDKVLGRKVKIRCKGCSTPIVVDGQKLGPSGPPSMGPSPETSAQTLVPSPSPDWSVNLSETDQRSMTTSQLVEAYQAGQVTAEAYVWREGMADWVGLLDSPELAPLLSATPGAAPGPGSVQPGNPQGYYEAPPPYTGYAAPSAGEYPGYVAPQAVYPAAGEQPAIGFPGAADSGSAPADAAAPVAAAPEQASVPDPAPESTKSPAAGKRAVMSARTRNAAQAKSAEAGSSPRSSAARVTGGRSQGAQDLFAGVESAGSEVLDAPPIASPALPQAGATAYADDRPTGARNENSVLFSLDSLKASPSSAPNARSHTADDPFGMGGSSGVAGLGGSNPLFTLADNQRLLSAPPPPPEPPPRPAVEATLNSVAPGMPLNRKVLGIAIGGVVLVLLLGVGIGAALSGDDDEEKAAAASALAEASAAPAPEKKEAEPPPTAAAPEPSAAPAADAKSDKPDDSASKDAKAGTASASKAGAKKDAKKEEAAPAPVADQPFNRGAAVSAMSAAASQAASCKKPGGPTGSGKATLTFSPTGRVTSATVDSAPFAGTAVGGCVASVFRRAKVPPFTGNSIKVSKSFTIP
jgi:predicted Zn finger-like uncharacterized protein